MPTLLTEIASIIEKKVENLVTKPLESALGHVLGKEVARFLFHRGYETYDRYPHLTNVSLPYSSVYGKTIQKVYGTTRVEGKIIWAQPIRHYQHHEVAQSKTADQKYTSKTFADATFAVSICAGPIHRVSKIWANDKRLNLETLKYRSYLGTEQQNPDPLIEETEGIAPAYRGLAYIVIENMPLADYNNRIPRLVFEVISFPEGFLQDHVTQEINAVHAIGEGEFTYDTMLQTRIRTLDISNKKIPYGVASQINGEHGSTYAITGLQSLRNTLPNVQWIAVTVYWFSSHPDIEESVVKPGTIYGDGLKTTPENWQVANYTYLNSHIIPVKNGKPKHEGTVSDKSLKRFLSELRSRKYKIMLQIKIIAAYDHSTKLTCGSQQASAASHIYRFFFQQYEPFAKHYFNLSKHMVDAFVIASGLSQLTKIRDVNGKYPAVAALKQLSQAAKTTLGSGVVITYAADYEEYHSNNEIYNMDELWASSSIDVIGINAYFPLLLPGQSYNKLSVEKVAQLWKSGEGYRYFHVDPNNNTEKEKYKSPNFAWKNISYWWRNHHISKGSTSSTPWKPRSKKIWFIEYGFKSIVNGKSSNITLDSADKESNAIPSVNYAAQKTAIEGTIKAWHASRMVEFMFLYAWNLKPIRDTENAVEYREWQTSYYVNNKLTFVTLSAVIYDILKDAGIRGSTVKISDDIHEAILGYTITERLSVREVISELQTVYPFDIRESAGQIVVSQESQESITAISSSDIEAGSCCTTYESEDGSYSPTLAYLSIQFNYQARLQRYRTYKKSHNTDTTLVPLVLDDAQVEEIVERIHDLMVLKKATFEVSLPIKHLQLDVGDVVKLEHIGYAMKITEIRVSGMRIHMTGHRYPV